MGSVSLSPALGAVGLSTARPEGDGWGGRIRTYVWRIQSPLPYHLATPQWFWFAHSIGSLFQIKNGPERDGPFMNAPVRVSAALTW